jgi:hypothetical protein
MRPGASQRRDDPLGNRSPRLPPTRTGGDSAAGHDSRSRKPPPRPRVSIARRRAILRIDALEAEWALRHALAHWLATVEACRRSNAADCARNPERVAAWVRDQIADLSAGVRT